MSDNDDYSKRNIRRIPAKNKIKEERNMLLEEMKKSKKSGFNYKKEIEEDDFDIMYDEEEPNMNDFIADYSGDEDDEYQYDNSDLKGGKRKKPLPVTNLKRSKLSSSQVVNKKPDTLMHSFLQSTSQKITLNKDGLDELLAQIVCKKPVKDLEIKNPYEKNNTKMPKFDINKPKDKIKPLEQKHKQIKESIVVKQPSKSSQLIKTEFKENIVEQPKSQKNLEVENKIIKSSDVDSMDFDDMDSVDFDDVEFDVDEPEKKIESKNIESFWVKEEIKVDGKIEVISQESSQDISKANCNEIYWLDMYQDKKIPGIIFLFGKVFDNASKTFISCAIRITGIERRLYFLPKDNSKIEDVFEELKTLFDKHGIFPFRCKVVKRKYAFQLNDVPDEADYLMVQYDSKLMELPTDITGRTFSRVFGTNTSCLETFILDLKLKGPCWLKFKNLEIVTNKFSSCKRNFQCCGIAGIEIITDKNAPKLSVLSLNIKTVMNPKTHVYEIVSAGCFLHNDMSFDQSSGNIYQKHFTIITHPKTTVMPYDVQKKIDHEWLAPYKGNVSIESTERSLISRLLANIQLFDPDLIVGHSLFGYQLEILLQRCQTFNLNPWHQLGRLHRKMTFPRVNDKSSSWIEKMATAGRMICDTAISARELVKCRSYELHDLITDVLPTKLHQLKDKSVFGDLTKLFDNSTGVRQLIDMTMNEALSNLHIMQELQILPLALQITSICGNLMSRTLSAGKSERNEFLLLHAFTANDYIVPDKITGFHKFNNNDDDHHINDQGKRKPAYAGGLVLDPKRGFYENFILLMDFNSLYPSIIQEFNICFTTIDRSHYDNLDVENNIDELLYSDDCSKPPGILPTEIKKLVDFRSNVKNELAKGHVSAERKIQLDIRQKALKITANSIYGCLGFTQSRFKAKHLAAMVTGRGREILRKTQEQVLSGSITLDKTQLALDIIYGDTDSIMVNTGINDAAHYDQVMRIGARIKEAVNKCYRVIKLDIDGVLRRILLLNKKKYAALAVVSRNSNTGELVTKQELKGLDIVRRDWCKLAIESGKAVVTKILESGFSHEDLAEDIHNYLKSVGNQVIKNKIPLDKFVITKALAKNPENYADIQGQPHVQVALRMNGAGNIKQFRAKDTVEYAICSDGNDVNATQRAYSPSEIKSNSQLTIDSEYYLAHQLHPVIGRLIEYISGMSLATVAENLGLDPKGYSNRHKFDAREDININDIEDQSTEGANKFKNCRPLVLACVNCNEKNSLAQPIDPSSLWSCLKCKKEMLQSKKEALNLSRQLIMLLRRTIQLNYQPMYTCTELTCQYMCRDLPTICHINRDKSLTKTSDFICPRCGEGNLRSLLPDSHIFQQLSFYKFILAQNAQFSRDYNAKLKLLSDQVDTYLARSEYSIIDCSDFLSKLLKSKLAFQSKMEMF